MFFSKKNSWWCISLHEKISLSIIVKTQQDKEGNLVFIFLIEFINFDKFFELVVWVKLFLVIWVNLFLKSFDCFLIFLNFLLHFFELWLKKNIFLILSIFLLFMYFFDWDDLILHVFDDLLKFDVLLILPLNFDREFLNFIF